MARVVEFQFKGDAADLQAALAGVHRQLGSTGKSSDDLQRAFDRLGTGGKAASTGVAPLGSVLSALKGPAGIAKGVVLGVGAAIATATAAAVAGVWAVLKFSEEVNRLAKSAKQLGTTVDDFQRLQGVIDLLAKGLGEEALGQLARAGVQTAEDLARVADEIAAIEDPTLQAERAVKRLGEAGLKLLPAMRGGGDAVRQAAAQIEEAGLISAETAEHAEALQDAVTLTGRKFDSLRAEVLAPLLPVLTQLAESLGDAFVALRDNEDVRDAARALADVLRNVVVPAAQVVVDNIDDVVRVLKDVEHFAQLAIPPLRAFHQLAGGGPKGGEFRVSGLEGLGKIQLPESPFSGLKVRFGPTPKPTRTTPTGGEDRERAARAAAERLVEIEIGALDNIRAKEEEVHEARQQDNADRVEAETELAEELAEVREREHAEELERIEAEKRARQAATEYAISAATALAVSLVSLGGLVTEAAIEQYGEQSEEAKKAALTAFTVNKIAAVAQAAVNTALAISNAIANAPNPIVGAILAIAAGLAGAAATVAIVAAPPPKFHLGGMVDEVDVRARRGEGVVTPEGVRAAGGPAGLRDLNQGRAPATGPIVVVQKLSHRVLDVQVHDSLRRRRGPLYEAIRAEQPRVGTHRVYVTR